MGRSAEQDGLELEEDLAHQRREWRIQRIGRFAMLLLVLAAVAGLLGPGPLSDARAGDPRGMQVEFMRFTRARAPEQLRIRVPAQAVRDGRVRIGLPHGFLDRIEVQRIRPEPESITAHPQRNEYEIAVAGAGAVEIVVDYEHRAFGRTPASVWLGGRPAVAFEQWVYP